jgi:gluconokinase
MPASLLDSQLATLERPGLDEHSITVDFALSVEQIVARAVAFLTGAEQGATS